MKDYLFLVLVAMILLSCEKEELNVGNADVYPRATFITICHRNADGGFQSLQIPQQALQAHLNHGDYLPDADGDGYTAIGSCTGTMNDCDDNDSSVHPGAEEICYDGVDNNCEGEYSEGCAPCPCYTYEDAYGMYIDNLDEFHYAFFYNAIETIDGVTLNGGSTIVLRISDALYEFDNVAHVLQDPVTYECIVLDLASGSNNGYSYLHTEDEFLACNEINLRFAAFLGCGIEPGLNSCD